MENLDGKLHVAFNIKSENILVPVIIYLLKYSAINERGCGTVVTCVNFKPYDPSHDL